MSGLALDANRLALQAIPAPGLGQSCPRQNPRLPGDAPVTEVPRLHPLGEPLSIRAVASMLGCSPWTVRQQHIPAGLPHFRSGAQGKLVFFCDQVVAWVLQQQKKGGK